MPPLYRERWVHIRLSRGMAYSSWASSTWRWASWVCAWVAKMSRMTSVRSMTLTSSGRLEVSRLRGAQVVVEDDDVGLVGLDQLLQLLDLARADVGGDVDLLPLLEHAADHVQAGRLGQAANLVQGIVMVLRRDRGG